MMVLLEDVLSDVLISKNSSSVPSLSWSVKIYSEEVEVTQKDVEK